MERIWLAEFESASQDLRAVTYTMHPEAIGRGYLVAPRSDQPAARR